jgi:hypothetical protein
VIRRWLARRKERSLHNDRDFECRYWWGDRGGYNFRQMRCLICNPEGKP